MISIFPVAIGGAMGALLRYTINSYCNKKFPAHFPYGTLIANSLGSLLAGLMLALLLQYNFPTNIQRFIIDGFLGALTTFSTFAFDSFFLWQEGHPIKAVFNIFLNLIWGFFLALLMFFTWI